VCSSDLAMYTRNPGALSSALEKISGIPQRVVNASSATAPMYIVDPMSSMSPVVSNNRTHPPVEVRIRILRGMAGIHSFESYQQSWRRVRGGRAALFTPNEIERWSSPYHPDNVERIPLGPALAFASGNSASAGSVPANNMPSGGRVAANDLARAKSNFIFIDCDCGVRLKIPPTLLSHKIRCPKCGKILDVTS
jgi:heat shock protein HtpX